MFKLLEQLRKENCKIGFTSGVFDLLHTGHIIMLQEADAHCDFLIVGLLSDPTIDRPDTKNYPIQTMFERWVQLESIGFIKKVIPFSTEEDLVNMIHAIRPSVRFVGEEYKGTEHTGYNIPGVEIVYTSRRHDYSSTELRKRLKL